MSTHKPANERSIDLLRDVANEAADEIAELADDLEAGTATPEQVAATMETVAGLHIPLEDAAEDVIEPDAAAWRAIDSARRSMQVSAGTIGLDGSAYTPLGLDADRYWSDAITSATAAAEYAEAARDTESPDTDD